MNDFNNYDVKRIDDCIDQLKLHFDTVEVFCSRLNGDGELTQTINRGAGNWYARYGHIKSYLHDVEKDYIIFNDKQHTQGDIL